MWGRVCMYVCMYSTIPLKHDVTLDLLRSLMGFNSKHFSSISRFKKKLSVLIFTHKQYNSWIHTSSKSISGM